MRKAIIQNGTIDVEPHGRQIFADLKDEAEPYVAPEGEVDGSPD